MKKCILATLALTLTMSAMALAGEEEFSEVEYYKQLAEKQLAQPATPAVPVAAATPVVYYDETCFDCEEDAPPPANVIAVIPQYFHSRNDAGTFKVGGQKLKISKGRANGAGVTLAYNRRVTDWFSFALMYEYGFMNVRGGRATAEADPNPATERSRWHSNVVGFLPEFNFGEFGKLQLSVIQGFDRAKGHEYSLSNPVDRRDIDDYGTNVTSLMAWYEKDFQIGCSNWKITPYAGWRSLYVVVKDANVWGAPAGTKNDDNLWVHLASGGVKASYLNGPLGINLRAGVSHRTSKDDIPGYGNRAVAPGVVHFSHKANLDKTVGSIGASISYAINKRAVVGIGYDATFGKDTSSHMGTLTFGFPF